MNEDILTDADRIKSILKANNGQMYQKEIVERVSWSPAKVSMELASMADDQDVYRQRIGRDKIVSLSPLFTDSLMQSL